MIYTVAKYCSFKDINTSDHLGFSSCESLVFFFKNFNYPSIGNQGFYIYFYIQNLNSNNLENTIFPRFSESR